MTNSKFRHFQATMPFCLEAQIHRPQNSVKIDNNNLFMTSQIMTSLVTYLVVEVQAECRQDLKKRSDEKYFDQNPDDGAQMELQYLQNLQLMVLNALSGNFFWIGNHAIPL